MVPLLLALLAPLSALAADAGKHPDYLHALTDMRTARALLEPRAGDTRAAEEEQAITHLNASINFVKAALSKDGEKEQPTPADANTDHESRLRQAESLLSKARTDIYEKEDDAKVREIRGHAVQELDHALHMTREAIYKVTKKK